MIYSSLQQYVQPGQVGSEVIARNAAANVAMTLCAFCGGGRVVDTRELDLMDSDTRAVVLDAMLPPGEGEGFGGC